MNCPKCGVFLSKNAKFCHKCGEKIEQMKKCPVCGAENNGSFSFCPSCGTQLSEETVSSETACSGSETVVELTQEESRELPIEAIVKKVCSCIMLAILFGLFVCSFFVGCKIKNSLLDEEEKFNLFTLGGEEYFGSQTSKSIKVLLVVLYSSLILNIVVSFVCFLKAVLDFSVNLKKDKTSDYLKEVIVAFAFNIIATIFMNNCVKNALSILTSFSSASAVTSKLSFASFFSIALFAVAIVMNCTVNYFFAKNEKGYKAKIAASIISLVTVALGIVVLFLGGNAVLELNNEGLDSSVSLNASSLMMILYANSSASNTVVGQTIFVYLSYVFLVIAVVTTLAACLFEGVSLKRSRAVSFGCSLSVAVASVLVCVSAGLLSGNMAFVKFLGLSKYPVYDPAVVTTVVGIILFVLCLVNFIVGITLRKTDSTEIENG